MSYKAEKPFSERKAECSKLIEKFPDRVPIIIEPRASFPGKLDKNKYLVPVDMNVGQVLHLIRRRSKCASHTGIFLFIDNVMPATTARLKDLADNHKSDDGFLYLNCCGEDTYGGFIFHISQ